MDGETCLDDESRVVAATDFGHIVHGAPLAIVRPASVRDVSLALAWAAQSRCQVAAQGRKHSVFGRCQVERGLALDMSSLRRVHGADGDLVVVDAGATWRDVLAATLPRGLAPPALPDYLGLSVGGTLVVGGMGSAASQFGAVSDNVVELQVVTGAGEVMTCSGARNPALFDAVRGGLGQVGVITRATLKLVPAPAEVRRFVLSYASLEALLVDQRLLAAGQRFDAAQGAAVPTPNGWSFRLDAIKKIFGRPPDDGELLAGLADDRPRAQIATLPYLDYLSRLDALEQALRDNGQWSFPHPWLTTFIGDSQAEAIVPGELTRLTPPDLGPFGQVLLSAFRTQAFRTPLLRLPPEPLCHVLNLVRIPASDDPTTAARLVAANRATYERLRAAGGTLYPVSAFAMSRDDWRIHFGGSFEALRAAKEEFDPANLLAPGYGVFEPAAG
ncbi:MAG: FAD-binding protein [Burkholderiales bacterium]|nr:FAD-binding protein [Burkholderiales bacterium]